MNLSNEQFEFIKDVSKLIEYCVNNNVKITGGELFRTKEQQDIYIKTGKSTTYNSNHLKRLAIDLNFFINEELCYDKKLLQHIGNYWESLNTKNKWGGNYKTFLDVPHFERVV